jgi:O-6-methylguanine DNA methyltransferase
MLNQMKNNNFVNTKISRLNEKAFEITKQNKTLKNFLELKSAQPKPVIEKIEINPQIIFFYTFDSDFGEITIFCDKSKIFAVDFDKMPLKNSYISKTFPDSQLVQSKKFCKKFYEELFLSNKEISIKAGIKGSHFFIKILSALSDTNPGELISYKKLGEKAGFSNAQRAVGTAMKNNPLPYLIPCHRVIKSDLRLGFYSGGIERKIIYILRENNQSVPKKISAS